MKPIIKITNLKLSYESFTVLNKVNLDINSNELTVIIGGNGSGKTTLIKAILGLHPIDHGQILIKGEKNTQAIISKNISYVPQYAKFDRDFPITVKEIIQLECNDRKKCNIGISGHLEEFNAGQLSNKKIGDLSGGELQKVMIARALIKDTDILILDEPTNNLDSKAIEYFQNKVNKLIASKKTIIIITHDVSFLNQVKNKKTYQIKNGSLQ